MLNQFTKSSKTVELCTAISETKVCEGDVDFHDVLEKKLAQPFVNNTGEVTAVVETERHSILKKENFKIIRNTIT